MLSDYPKLECPFVRAEYHIDKKDFKKHGRRLQLREPKVYVVENMVNPCYEWVFDDPETIAVEKLDGTNVKLKTENGRLTQLQNRKNVLDPLQIISGKAFIIDGVLRAAAQGYIKKNGEQAGEVLGPKLQGNPYGLKEHIWYPFEKTIESLLYKSFNKHERTFENISSWFKDYLKSFFYARYHKIKFNDCQVFAEGVIFYNLKRKAQEKTWRAKLRRDMFDWYYKDYVHIGEKVNDDHKNTEK